MFSPTDNVHYCSKAPSTIPPTTACANVYIAHISPFLKYFLATTASTILVPIVMCHWLFMWHEVSTYPSTPHVQLLPVQRRAVVCVHKVTETTLLSHLAFAENASTEDTAAARLGGRPTKFLFQSSTSQNRRCFWLLLVLHMAEQLKAKTSTRVRRLMYFAKNTGTIF